MAIAWTGGTGDITFNVRDSVVLMAETRQTTERSMQENWYFMRYDDFDEARSRFRDARVPAEELHIKVAIDGDWIPFDGVAFPAEYLPQAEEALGIPSGEASWEKYETNREGVVMMTSERFRSRKVTGRGDHLESWGQIRPELVKIAMELEIDIFCTNPHGSRTQVKTSDDKLYIRFYSRPTEVVRSNKRRFRQAFGIQLAEGQRDGLKPSVDYEGTIFDITDDSEQVVAQVCEGTLYVLFDLPHSGNESARLIRALMEAYVDSVGVDSGEREARRVARLIAQTKESKNKYVELCRTRRNSTVTQFETQLRNAETHINDYSRALADYYRQASEAREKLDYWKYAHKDDVGKYELEFDKLLETEGITGVVVDEGVIKIFTHHIVIEYVDENKPCECGDPDCGSSPSHTQTGTWDMGTYRIELHTESDRPFMRVYNNTRTVNTHAHPHIRNGAVCMGNMGEGLTKLIATHQYSVLAQMMLQFLGSYNQRDPYQRITEWPRYVAPVKEKVEVVTTPVADASVAAADVATADAATETTTPEAPRGRGMADPTTRAPTA